MLLGYSAMTAGIYDLDEAFALAGKLGFEFVELSHDVSAFLPRAQPARRVRELSRATGVATTLHLPFIDLNLASLSEPVRRLALEQTLSGLEYAAEVGARCTVLHTGTVFIYQPRPLEDASAALLASLGALAGQGVPVALENLGLYVDGLVRGPEMLRRITRKSGMVNCLDFGHAHIEAARPWANGRSELISSYLETLGEAVVHLHLCNNDGENDLHAATPDGSVDYVRHRAFLAGFGGSACLEVAGGPESVRRSAAHIRGILEASPSA